MKCIEPQSERVARGGEGMPQDAKTERDKVQLSITLWQDDQDGTAANITQHPRIGCD